MKVLFAESHNLDRPDPVGSHHYIRLFHEEGHDCLWVGPAISPMHLFKPDRLNRYRFRRWRGGVADIDGIRWVVPLTLLFYYNKPLLRSLCMGRNQYRWCLPPLKGQLKKAGFDGVDLLWCAGPVAYSLLDLIPHRLSCFRLADRLDQFSGIPGNVGKLQEELIQRVDMVFATARSLYEWALTIRSDNVFYLPNGVNEAFFSPGDDHPVFWPRDRRKVVIYTGTVDSRFNLDLVERAAYRMKDFHFLIVGPVSDKNLEERIRSLTDLDNLDFTGPLPYSKLPAYLHLADAGLIPFYLNDRTAAVNPIKYYEYLAAGLPVVAPPMAELTGMGGPLHCYRDEDEFEGALREAAARREESDYREKLVHFARDNTWRSRYLEVTKIIEDRLKS